MPYIFLGVSFVLKYNEFEKNTTHLTDSSIENLLLLKTWIK